VPIIIVKLKPGRSDEQKAAFDVSVRIAAVRDLGATESAVFVDYIEE
jgi:phenylpyruvate tautomerase PptA (4-oxalocrotonate tautomerase family)